MTRIVTEMFEQIRFGGYPIADPDSIVVSGNVPFTVLTLRLIRLEWSATGEFEDRGMIKGGSYHADRNFVPGQPGPTARGRAP